MVPSLKVSVNLRQVAAQALSVGQTYTYWLVAASSPDPSLRCWRCLLDGVSGPVPAGDRHGRWLTLEDI